MKLFFSPTSPYVRKCLAAAHELGLAGRIELLPSKASPVLGDASIAPHNPLGKVPTLITDDGQALYDSRVICEYLDALAGGILFPQGQARWNALTLQALGDGMLDASLLARYEEALRPEALRWADWRSGQIDKVRAALRTLESGTPPLDDTVHIGSIAVGCALWYLDLRFADLAWREQAPTLAQWWAGFGSRPSMTANWALAAA
jgi:glutathione S-transferase